MIWQSVIRISNRPTRAQNEWCCVQALKHMHCIIFFPFQYSPNVKRHSLFDPCLLSYFFSFHLFEISLPCTINLHHSFCLQWELFSILFLYGKTCTKNIMKLKQSKPFLIRFKSSCVCFKVFTPNRIEDSLRWFLFLRNKVYCTFVVDNMSHHDIRTHSQSQSQSDFKSCCMNFMINI